MGTKLFESRNKVKLKEHGEAGNYTVNVHVYDFLIHL